ncbi:MAG: tRNA pseudouridine(13) synthase TruD [Gemmatimonadota bacterium]|nr:tRNA pseudouridine(13) synthase TruD [Gemmatimonadota bacterium]
MEKLPYLTADLPGIGGIIKVEPADFMVEEIPIYQPSGTGEHVYFTIEKNSITTSRAVEIMARELGINQIDMGYAGLKDKHAIAIQHLTACGVSPEQVMDLDIPGVRVLSADRHVRKLRTGHLRGNRFKILIRQVKPGAVQTARTVLELLERRGLPNYYGKQRFGARKNTHLLGGALLRKQWSEVLHRLLGCPGGETSDELARARQAFDEGRFEHALELYPKPFYLERKVLSRLIQSGRARTAVRSIPFRLRRLYLSGYQSYLFNLVLRLRVQSIDEVWEGDLAYIHASGGVFSVTAPEVEGRRVREMEISPSGPIYGEKMPFAGGRQGDLEREILAGQDLTVERFKSSPGGVKLPGARRPLRIPLSDISLHQEEDSLLVEFFLPKGAYATIVLREICKND